MYLADLLTFPIEDNRECLSVNVKKSMIHKSAKDSLLNHLWINRLAEKLISRAFD